MVVIDRLHLGARGSVLFQSDAREFSVLKLPEPAQPLVAARLYCSLFGGCPMAPKRESWFLADCETNAGKKVSVWVDREGSSVHLSPSNGYKSHLCHTSVSTMDEVKSEISIVYALKVISIKSKSEVALMMNRAIPSAPPPGSDE